MIINNLKILIRDKIVSKNKQHHKFLIDSNYHQDLDQESINLNKTNNNNNCYKITMIIKII